MDMLRRVFRNRFAQVATGLCASYWIIAANTKSKMLIEYENWILVFVSVAVTFVYFPIMWSGLQEKKLDKVTQLSIGIWISWAITAVIRAIGILWRSADMPSWMQENDIIGFTVFLLIAAAVLHITAPGIGHNEKERRSWLVIAFAVALGIAAPAFAGGYLLGFFALVYAALVRFSGN